MCAGRMIMHDCTKSRAHKSESVFLKRKITNCNPFLNLFMNNRADSVESRDLGARRECPHNHRLKRVPEANWQYRRGRRKEVMNILMFERKTKMKKRRRDLMS